MIALSLSQIAPLLEAEMFGGDASFGSVSSDTRTLTPGDLFVALQGTNFDGHDYLETARERGAVAVLVSRAISGGLPGLRVRDTKIALGRLAAFWRQHSAAPLIGVTGSNG
ncbi:MAG: UDP-N-acetylmuramoyl-tripeptide--D-alanyl-D-alanine ligase, partial [Gammaproteobacteria bacterium]|nr:UDP-N-acetylmuramoyl-tripeptide--D-alanyl-D-alanine ligase [Gammaproteobacteria bacterium]